MPRSSELLVACIAALSALAGTVVGAVVTYEGNKQLQDRQLTQEEARQTRAARAVARLLMAEYKIDGGGLEDMVYTREYNQRTYRRHTLVSRLGTEERKLLAGQLSEQDWEDVSIAARKLEEAQADLEAHRGSGEVGYYEYKTLSGALSACKTAFEALTPLASGQVTS